MPSIETPEDKAEENDKKYAEFQDVVDTLSYIEDRNYDRYRDLHNKLFEIDKKVTDLLNLSGLFFILLMLFIIIIIFRLHTILGVPI